jgi:hypothetical protein
MLATVAAWRKSLAAALGSLVTALAFTHNIPFLPASLTTEIGVVVAVLTPIITWLVPPNKTKAAGK